jgi:hypothetical protein
MYPEFPVTNVIEEVLPAFYNKYDLGRDGGISADEVKIIFYKNIYLYIPNINARKKAVLKHDIHHIVTGYTSDFKGETEISAWEIASGCKRYWAAAALDLSGMTLGFLFNLRGVFRAFVIGKRTRNLYDNAIPDNEVVKMTIGELRARLGLDATTHCKPTIKVLISFLWWEFKGAIYIILSALLLPLLIIYTIVIAMRKQ